MPLKIGKHELAAAPKIARKMTIVAPLKGSG